MLPVKQDCKPRWRMPLSKPVCAVVLVLLVISFACSAAPGRDAAKPGRQFPVFPKSPPPAKTLMHADLLDAPDDVRLALTVLQGLVNREQPRIYITQNPGWHTPAAIPKWMEGLKARGYSFTEVPDPLSLVSTFRKNIKGAVIYEPDLTAKPESLHKLNALTLYCALNDAIPLTPDLNSKLGLPVVLDARGKYNTAREAYGWAYRDLWPRANHSAVAFTCPTHIVLRDYLVANKIMPFWISKDMDERDEETVLRIMDEAEPNSPVMGCWGGYGEIPAARRGEAELQRIASLRGKFIVVTDGCFNLTVHSGLRFTVPVVSHAPTHAHTLAPKVYLLLNFTDGDNLQYIQQYFRSPQWWEDPNRGKVPLSWSLNPAAAAIMPDVVEYLLSTRTQNDEFVCSTAGIGLATPSLYGKDTCASPSAVHDDYLRLTSQSMRMVGLKSIHLGDTSAIPWSRADLDEYAKKMPWLDGIIGDYGPSIGVNEGNAAFFTSNGIPVVRALTAPGDSAPNENSARRLADAIKAAAPSERPGFMHVCLINWFNSPTVVKDALDILGPDYVPLLPSDFFALMRQSRAVHH